MNISIQKCNNCGTLNTASDATWIRIFGAFSGAPALVTNPTAPLSGGTTAALIDLCATCAGSVTVADLVTLTTAAKAPPAAAASTAKVITPAETGAKG